MKQEIFKLSPQHPTRLEREGATNDSARSGGYKNVQPKKIITIIIIIVKKRRKRTEKRRTGSHYALSVDERHRLAKLRQPQVIASFPPPARVSRGRWWLILLQLKQSNFSQVAQSAPANHQINFSPPSQHPDHYVCVLALSLFLINEFHFFFVTKGNHRNLAVPGKFLTIR